MTSKGHTPQFTHSAVWRSECFCSPGEQGPHQGVGTGQVQTPAGRNMRPPGNSAFPLLRYFADTPAASGTGGGFPPFKKGTYFTSAHAYTFAPTYFFTWERKRTYSLIPPNQFKHQNSFNE